MPARTASGSSAWTLFGKLFLLIFSAVSLWSLATPLMAVPDEPAHTIKAAAVVRGQITIEEGTSFGHGVHVRVPAYIANLHAQDCYKFRPDTAANCAPVIPSDANDEAIGVTSAGSYNPMYYWIVGLPSLVLTGQPALFAMRILSALLSAAFYSAGFTALAQLRQARIPVLMASLAVTPMVLFLAAGINPNSLEIAATMAAFCGFVVTLDNAHRVRHVLPAVITVIASTIVLANTRQVSLVWLLCALIAGVLLFRGTEIKAAFRSRLVLTGAAFTVPGVLLGIYWIYLMLHAPANSGVAPEGIANPQPGVSIYRAFLTMVEKAPEFVQQYIGVMGWLDTPVPMAVVMFWSTVFVVAVLLPLLIKPFKTTLGAWAALAMLIVVPAILQASIWKSMGFVWQGRYNLPLVVVLLIAVGMTARRVHFPQSAGAQSVARVVLWAAAFCHLLAFAFVLRRYVVGTFGGGNWHAMINGVQWQPPLGWFLLTLMYLAVVVTAASWLFRLLFPGAVLVQLRRTLSRG
ncbi:hypothetical protein BJG92_01384 [Arthrobacter sp. SO5]|uniref:DUF2142 domain-containing protein n=1 Tax=Arthrobacter sp. SO5 TaxID=1897055 RepID=UPI001E5C6D78|nr:DUF2142 domain-containing protein [Arthrobacter sp. SO5]MCB5273859.1 hypothetical protein [Arthrobacter sp. SO5]